MDKRSGIIFLFFLLSVWQKAFTQNEPFTKRTVISGLNSPWEISYGPNDSLWVTENTTYLVKRVSIATGASTTLLNLSALKNFAANDGGRWPQGGLMGLAIHPNLYSSDPAVRGAKPWVYLAYVYDRPTGQNCSTNANSSDECFFHSRIVRYNYNGSTLSSPVIVLDNMPGSNDHNSGRLTIGPDLKLYYTIGDMGAGQFNNGTRTNNAQNVDVLEGKILRLNTESDGDPGTDAWAPDDNPFYDGTPISPRDYVYSMGHRNAQGIVWADINGSSLLYSSEHGDKTDDEVNLISGGQNYGWNQVSGYCDGNYNGLTLGGRSGVNENSFCSTTPNNREPLTTMFTLNQSGINALSTDYLTWPTVAPSSIDMYSFNRIPGWQNSLLVPCLKAGRVYRLKLNSTGTAIVPNASGTDTVSYFRGLGRYRDLALSPDGMKIYVACDASGQTSGPSGGFNGGGTPPPNAGSILEFTYSGIVLALSEPQRAHPDKLSEETKIYPNPAEQWITISVDPSFRKPLVISIYTMSGEWIRSIKTSKNSVQVPLSGLTPGMYFIQVRNEYDRILQTTKIVKI
ncbi:MAG: PQQ-dependent sugar dehydrogenase [Flavisolibacter sp.]